MPSNPANTAFVLVPGGFCLASLYHKVTDRLTKLGYLAIESDHPTVVSPDKASKTFYDDAGQVRSVASRLLDEGKTVIIVCNSYGGFVGTEAVKGLSQQEREAQGKSGGLANLVLQSSLLPPRAGMTCHELVSGVVDVILDAPSKLVLDAPPAESAGPQLFQRLPPEEALVYGKQLTSMARAAVHGPLTHLGYLHVPTTFIIATEDVCVATKAQEENFDAVVVKQGLENVVSRTLVGNHCAMVSHPDEFVEALVEVAEMCG